MKTVIRRITIFPIMLFIAPFFWFLSWCFDSPDPTKETKEFLRGIWDGDL